MNTVSSSSRTPHRWSLPGTFESLETISTHPSHLVPWREWADAGFKLSSYVFIGQRTSKLPVRIAVLAGLRSRDLGATRALAKLLVELEVAPLAGADYALFSYAVTRQPELDLHSDFDHDLPPGGPRESQTVSRLIETDLKRNDVDGVISLETNEHVNGFQIETDSELIATEVAWPALEVAGRFVPLAEEPVKVLGPGVLGYESGGERGIPKQMFALNIRTPQTSPPEDQVSAIVFSSIRVLKQYRELRRATLDL
jgi:hypothetical protein